VLLGGGFVPKAPSAARGKERMAFQLLNSFIEYWSTTESTSETNKHKKNKKYGYTTTKDRNETHVGLNGPDD
jgi:hypothetical protein